MRLISWFAATLVVACARGSHRAPPDAKLEAELRAADAARNVALRAADTTALARLYADDFLMITSTGQIRTKRDQLRDIGSAVVQHQGAVERILHLTLSGDVAVVQGESDAGTLVTGGNVDLRRRRYTRVYVRRDGRWQLLATHISVVTDSGRGG